MILLPIVHRELRVRARLKGTHSVRVAAGTFALLVAAVAINQSQLGLARGLTGEPAFVAMTVLAMLYCLAEGIRSTADCLSEEKREGTLGLLFLTELRGYDVVLGKLAATSLNSLYGLLAIVPVLALPRLANVASWREIAAPLAVQTSFKAGPAPASAPHSTRSRRVPSPATVAIHAAVPSLLRGSGVSR
jgi:ABC-type transport system involved in cytochrome c biogenesis permease component